MGGVTVSKDSSGEIMVSFPYDPQLVAKVKTIKLPAPVGLPPLSCRRKRIYNLDIESGH